ncbi:TonB-linked SusC/RagA family outer membrane protein [Catalinimonas alkaloidigena]|uniref:SusC/RagA family TonB-linked outer membrane protein n=1 Tax=Catalinimonas alkaloidigena TaxID=1075417 RepID=UPI00240529E0|nr:SusC/RagA family TonB-linked outer membrane protein [Catalinimonas alkaloidigena]MDF9799264.1 TonB-linked SusC/RagA family outer membrane protein [Catalinimonas alkaloidigena]
MCLISFSALAQEHIVTGTIISAEDNSPIPGVNVLVRGSTTGTISNINGEYSIEASSDTTTLVFSFIGFQTKEVAVENQSVIDIKMQADVAELSEVVVTAFGLEREKKALGYTVQEISGKELAEARQANVANSLSGKVAGVQVISNAGPGSGSTITIRGQSSISGNNQPLIVVDGVPIENYSNPFGSDENQYGGGLSEVSPDNIEDISVLKGPNAAALYGSRAANGVILITTKDGSGTNGIGISVNSNVTWDSPLVVPDFQDIYGGGTGGITWYADGRNGPITDPAAINQFQSLYPNAPLNGTAGVDESWGAPMDGRLVQKWWSNGELVPLTPNPDNFTEFFQTGHTLTNNVAIAGSNDKGNFRLSLGRLDQEGMVHNNDYYRNNFRINTGYNFTDKLNITLSAEYIKSGSNNRRYTSGSEFIWHQRHLDFSKLKEFDKYKPETVIQPDGEYYPYANWQYEYFTNPYYTQEFWTYANEKDRLLGNITLNYQLTDHLSVMARSGTDFWTDSRENIIAEKESRYYPNGAYEESVLRRQETNSDFLITYDNSFGDFLVTANVGGNNRANFYKRSFTRLNDLTVNKLYNLGNNASPPITESAIEEYEVNSLYGAATLGFKNYLFLDITGRNDWSSTLPVDNNSYFYPSASLSAVVTDMLDIQSGIFSFAKLRASWAQVGNSADPYQLQQVYNPEALWDGNTPSFSESTEIANSELKPEITTGIELGADLRFLNGRLGLDFTYYNQSTKDQILAVEISKATSYNSRILNAGEVTNKGVEVMLSGTPLQLNNGLRWDVSFNFSRNRNIVVELAEGLDVYTLNTYYISSEARVGQPYGTLYGRPFERVQEGPYAGELIMRDGLPVTSTETAILGNIQPDWLGGFSNSITYKGLTVSALIDVRKGGDMFMLETGIGRRTGVYEETAVGREEGVIGKGVREVFDNEGELIGYESNNVIVSARDYYYENIPRSRHEAGIFDGSYVKLREATISYQLPGRWFNNNFLESARVSLVGRNVAILFKNTPHHDPEADRYGGNRQGFSYSQLPTTRNLGFNVNVNF